MSDTIKFRETGNEKEIIEKTRKLLGLNSDSCTIRILLNLGYDRINDYYKNFLNVSHPLKYSEIDFLTSSLNVYLKEKKKEESEKESEKY
jgi:hypothetical protein